jgi:flagellin-specific chaperone FliS
MKEFIEKLLGRLEERIQQNAGWDDEEYWAGENFAYEDAIEIVNELAEEYKPTKNADIQEVIDNLEVYTVGRLNTSKVEISVLQLQRYINRLKQIAEEYNNDFCEWKKKTIAEIDLIREPHRMYLFKESVDKWEYCPYCGKKIKVVE